MGILNDISYYFEVPKNHFWNKQTCLQPLGQA